MSSGHVTVCLNEGIVPRQHTLDQHATGEHFRSLLLSLKGALEVCRPNPVLINCHEPPVSVSTHVDQVAHVHKQLLIEAFSVCRDTRWSTAAGATHPFTCRTNIANLFLSLVSRGLTWIPRCVPLQEDFPENCSNCTRASLIRNDLIPLRAKHHVRVADENDFAT